MEIILIEKHKKLGSIGDIVDVKPGYARNYLIPKNVALRATKHNIDLLESRKSELEADNKKKHEDAKSNLPKIDTKEVLIIRQAGEDGKLFGSVTLKDIATKIEDSFDLSVDKDHIEVESAIKRIGLYDVKVMLHPEVTANVVLNVARSEDEANEARKSPEKTEEKKQITEDAAEVTSEDTDIQED